MIKKHSSLLFLSFLGFIFIISSAIYNTDFNRLSINSQKELNKGIFVCDLMLATFKIDVTPPVGFKMAFGTVEKKGELGLTARGIILKGAGEPIVICALDWHSIANKSQDLFREALADAAGTVPERVVVHALHQHDAPICDFSAEEKLKDAGLDPHIFEGDFARQVIKRLSETVKMSMNDFKPVTHIGYGSAEVYKVASNRRILENGKVKQNRSSSTRSAELRAEPEGLIDPMVSVISFWNNENPVAVLSFYATHPQSYYRTGIPNPDFPGIARFYRQLQVPDALHVHFNGAGGNVAAGKYNDGSHENRGILAKRLADGMKRAWEDSNQFPVNLEQVEWEVESVALPPAEHLYKLRSDVKADNFLLLKNRNAQKLAWLERCEQGKKIDIQCLAIGDVRVLFMPGELFVEYQLAAKKMRPDLFIAMAAYQDFGPHYIGTTESYKQGGYEISASDVAPEVEKILMTAIESLLNKKTD